MLIEKRDGSIEEFDYLKIEMSVMRALDNCSSVKKTNRLAGALTKAVDKAVSSILHVGYVKRLLTTQTVREAIEKELVQIDYYVARDFMLYPYTKKGGEEGAVQDTSEYSE